MTREVSIFSNPVAAPGVCGKCGSQSKDWYVDLGFDLEMQKYEPGLDLAVWLDGVIYLCCDCINNLMTDVDRRFREFIQDHYVRTTFNGIGIEPDPLADEPIGGTEPYDSDFEQSFGEDEPEPFIPNLGIA